MKIAFKGHGVCNLYVGGDRRDHSVQKFIESSPCECFFIMKKGADLEIWGAEEVQETVSKSKKDNKPKIVKMSKKKTTKG